MKHTKRRYSVEDFKLTPEDLAKLDAAKRERLAKMSPEERATFLESEEADAWKEALSDEEWGKS